MTFFPASSSAHVSSRRARSGITLGLLAMVLLTGCETATVEDSTEPAAEPGTSAGDSQAQAPEPRGNQLSHEDMRAQLEARYPEATLTDTERTQLGDLLKPGNETLESQLTITRPVVREWTIADLDELLALPAGGPDLQNGRKLFEAVLCSRCHKLANRGGVVGPDLTSVAGRFSRRDILTSILDPSRIIAGKYRNAQIVTTKGKTIVGRVITGGDYRSPKLKIATDPLRPSRWP